MNDLSDVLIVGAGPTGLSLAIMLTMNNINCKIIDKRKQNPNMLRALSISKAAEDVFSSIGVLDAIKEKALLVEGTLVQHYLGIDMELNYKELNVNNKSLLNIYQPVIEEILVNRLRMLNVEVYREHELISLKNGDDYVETWVSNDEKIDNEIYKYIIGCDGANSKVRMLCGIEEIEEKYPHGFILADVTINQPLEKCQNNLTVHESGFIAVIPGTDNMLRLVISMPNYEEIKITPEYLQNEILQKCNNSISIDKIIWEAKLPYRHKFATAGKLKRVFLAGDSYHIFSPIGGLNMSFGLHDASSLAWRIVLVLQQNTILTY